MNRKEFYNSCLDFYKKIGQGVPEFLMRMKVSDSVIDGLIAEGKLKLVQQEHAHMHICVTGAYCVEEDEFAALTFLRIYMKLDLGLGVKPSDILDEPDLKAKYDAWLEKNKEQLLKMNTLEEITD